MGHLGIRRSKDKVSQFRFEVFIPTHTRSEVDRGRRRCCFRTPLEVSRRQSSPDKHSERKVEPFIFFRMFNGDSSFPPSPLLLSLYSCCPPHHAMILLHHAHANIVFGHVYTGLWSNARRTPKGKIFIRNDCAQPFDHTHLQLLGAQVKAHIQRPLHFSNPSVRAIQI